MSSESPRPEGDGEDTGATDGGPQEVASDAAELPEPRTGPEEEPHDDAGLDLARRIARATAAGGLPPDKRSRRRRPRGDAPRKARGDDRDPQLLEGSLSRLVADHGWALDLRVHGVFARWPDLVGEEIAGHCTPESFTEGRLLVRTDSTAWATQLKLLAPRVLARLNEELGPGTVTFLDVQGPHAPSWTKGPRRVKGRGPRDTYG
ncbi:DciA family protein [Nocardioides sp. BSK12Z-3]|nr:DciA family protein [Nocardioides bruguierae]MCL8026723.1 DciA family protein [Nocardioides bruguierae]